MERSQESNERVRITKAVFDGLEFIRQSGATNMLDRSVVLQLAKESDLTETAEWIAWVTTGVYGRVILEGADIVDADPADPDIDDDPPMQVNGSELTANTIDQARWQNVIASLGKRATATLADTYDTEMMGVLGFSQYRDQINVERTALIRNLAEASNLAVQLEEVVSAVEYGIASLQYMIDPENN